MTLYWWTHWFWITLLNVLVNGQQSTLPPDSLLKNKWAQTKLLNAKPTAIDENFERDNYNLSDINWMENSSNWSTNVDISKERNLSKNRSSYINNTISDHVDNSVEDGIADLYNNTNLTNINIAINKSTFGTIDINTTVVSIEEDIKSSQRDNKTNNFIDVIKEKIIIKQNVTHVVDIEQKRKSKILNEYREKFKINNFTGETKNILARSASDSLLQESGETLGGNGLTSEALLTSAISRQSDINELAISILCIILVALIFGVSVTGFILYRRRYNNQPQTLSEPDSSGYIDDSTIRENSDEMYSLDNDSFLNSLEAMTIQSYWTDNVKHTKL